MTILKTKLSKIPIKNENTTNNVNGFNIDKIIVIPLLKGSRFSLCISFNLYIAHKSIIFKLA